MNVAFMGFNEKTLTLKTSQTIEKGTPVTMSANGTVEKASAGSAFIGIAQSQRGELVEVQLYGYVKSEYTSTAPSVGRAALGANGTGGVKTVSSGGTDCIVLSVDTANSTVEYLI
ncbi:MAG: hypothetical protein IJS17_04160 [Clostridia bacterium]|nr:hypothetical protein [Clostridia bacterium]